ncbi:hypothetical protein IVA98_31445 [Bradyrhizobium sp. 160]|nr:hypothetical protein [Bradyrhizobium sp. 160]
MSFETASVLPQQEYGSAMALPKQVLAYVAPGFVLERNAFDTLCCFEIGHWKLNLHDGPSGDRQPKIGMLPSNITLAEVFLP